MRVDKKKQALSKIVVPQPTLDRPFSEILMEMVYQGLYHFTSAYQDDEYNDPVKFLADEAKLFGIIKRSRRKKSPLINASEP